MAIEATPKKRNSAKAPAFLSRSEQKVWRGLVLRLERMERGLDELSSMRAKYQRKEDFDHMAAVQGREMAEIERQLRLLERDPEAA